MKTIILCNQLRGLKQSLKSIPGPLHYISFVETGESREICSILRGKPGAQELPKAKLFRERSRDFRNKYIEFLGRLNIQNHSPDWWAMPFTNKNPLATTLCRDTANFLLTTKLASLDPAPLVVISDSVDLAAQVKTWAKGEGIQVKDLIRAPGRLKSVLKRFTPAGILRSAALTLVILIRARRFRPVHDLRNDQIVIASLTYPRSFSAQHRYNDVYFGPLVDHVAASEERAFVLGMLLERPLEQLKQIGSLQTSVPVVPMEACITMHDFLACTLRALRMFVQPVNLRGPVEINGLDLSCLVNRSILNTRHSGDFFLNLRVYYCGRWLGRNLRVARCMYPYENRSWEKMLLLGIRASSPQTLMVGYQHAAISLSHTNFILAEGEDEVVPLPKSILTTGDIPRRWLEEEGHYPAGIFKNACALRQGQPAQPIGKTRSGRVTRVFVALGPGAEEYLNALTFLEQAFTGVSGYELRIRPHPESSLDPALAIAQSEQVDFFTLSSGSLAEDLQWADVALYASSTVGLEAMSLGIPVIYLDLGDFLDTNPIIGRNEFTWLVDDPGRLVDTIQQIDRLPEAEFRARQKNGQKYSAAYLAPVTAAGLRQFLD